MFILSKYDSIHQLLHNFGENQVLHNRHYEKFADGTVKDIEDEIPFEVPEGWAWCRLSEIAELKGGKRIPAGMSATKDKTDHIYIRVSDMKNDTISTDDLRYISDTIFEQIKQYIIGKNDLYLTIAGTIGRVGEVPELFDKMNLTENALKITNIKLNKRYLLILLKSPFVQDYFEGTYHQVAMPKLSLTNASKTLLPIPSMNTQKLIVERYFSLNEKIDTLDSNKETLEQAIKQAKSKILDLAIHGKLVPQDSSDEPASVLLEKLRAEKEAKIKAGELKRDKNDSYIYKSTTDNCYYEKFNGKDPVCIDEEIPFDIPVNWQWVKLNELADIARGGSPRPIEAFITDSSEGINWIKIGDTSPESKYIISAKEKIIPEGKKHSRYVHSGDFLLTNSMSFGRPYILKIDGCIHDGWLVFGDIKESILQDYLYLALSSDYVYNAFSLVAAGSTVKNLKSETVKATLFPLPPISEQKRIVSKIEEMFERLDQIQNNLI